MVRYKTVSYRSSGQDISCFRALASLGPLVVTRSITQNYIPDARYLTWNSLPPVEMSCDARCIRHLDTSSHQRMNIHLGINIIAPTVKYIKGIV